MCRWLDQRENSSSHPTRHFNHNLSMVGRSKSYERNAVYFPSRGRAGTLFRRRSLRQFRNRKPRRKRRHLVIHCHPELVEGSSITPNYEKIFHLYRSARTYRRLQQSRVTSPIAGLRRHHSSDRAGNSHQDLYGCS